MKKYISISLFVFFLIITVILVCGLVFNGQTGQNVQYTATSSVSVATPSAVSGGTPANPTIKPTTKVLDMNEVAKHNQASDCWQVIGGNVYDFSPYLAQHPGGERAMVPYCGQEATQAYDSKGGRGQGHSSRAKSELSSFLVGPLGQTVSVSQNPVAPVVSPQVQNSNTSSRFFGNREDD